MNSRTRVLTLIAAAALVALSLGGAAAVAASKAATGNVACTLVSPVQLRAIVGLSHSTVLSEHGGTAPFAEDVNTECDNGAWSGPTPTTLQQVMQTARSGHAAQVGFETWAPNKKSPDVKTWLNKDYDKLTGGFDISAVTFPGLFSTAGWPAHRIAPPKLGYDAAGFQVAVQGIGKGLIAAVGCWWDDRSSSAVCMFDEEAAGKPVVKHLASLAKIAVPKFFG